MKIEKLFGVLVVTGMALGSGIVGCSGDDDGGDDKGASGGKTGSSSGGGSADACEDVCGANTSRADWTDCNGCCCWLAVGQTSPIGTPICGEEPCCIGRGR